MKIVPAAPAHVPRLAELLGILFAREGEFSADPAAQAEGLRLILAAPATGAVLVAVDGETITGMVNTLFTVSTYLGGRVAILDDLVVDPAYRGRGIGSALLDAAIEQARASGCLRMSLFTDRSNAAARTLYRTRGFVESSMIPHTLILR